MSSRKKFILSFSGLLGSAFLLKHLKFWNKAEKNRKVKMLTQKGELVEIDTKYIPSKKKPVTDKELQTWIWKNVKW